MCGGCQWQHLNYEAQIYHKEKVVREAMYRIGKVRAEEFFPIVAAEKTTYYRNKLEYAFSECWFAQICDMDFWNSGINNRSLMGRILDA